MNFALNLINLGVGHTVTTVVILCSFTHHELLHIKLIFSDSKCLSSVHGPKTCVTIVSLTNLDASTLYLSGVGIYEWTPKENGRKEIGLRAQKLLIIVKTTINIIWRIIQSLNEE